MEISKCLFRMSCKFLTTRTVYRRVGRFFNPELLTGALDHAEYHTLLQGCGSGSRRGKFEGKTEKVRKTEENCNFIIKY